MENNNSAVQFNFAKVRIRPRAGYVHFACSQYPHSPGTLLDVDVAETPRYDCPSSPRSYRLYDCCKFVEMMSTLQLFNLSFLEDEMCEGRVSGVQPRESRRVSCRWSK